MPVTLSVFKCWIRKGESYFAKYPVITYLCCVCFHMFIQIVFMIKYLFTLNTGNHFSWVFSNTISKEGNNKFAHCTDKSNHSVWACTCLFKLSSWLNTLSQWTQAHHFFWLFSNASLEEGNNQFAHSTDKINLICVSLHMYIQTV